MRDDTRYEKVEKQAGNPHGWITLSSGREVRFGDALNELEAAETSLVRWMSRAFKLSEGVDFEAERLEWYIEQMEELVEAWKDEVEKRTRKKAKRERIDKLRQVAGRYPEEKPSYLAKADKLERGLE
jgi:hypothetical protein